METCLIGVGTNLGDRSHAIEFAAQRLRAHEGIENLLVSGGYETKPIGGPSGQGTFTNATFVLETSLSADALLALLQQIEGAAGRVKGERWAPRSLDLDLLLFGDAVIEQSDLVVPHPRMSFRRFVLEPANEIAPQMVHPTTGLWICELTARLETTLNYVAIAGAEFQQRESLVRDVASQHAAIKVLTAPPTRQHRDDSPSLALELYIEFLDQQLACLRSMSNSSKEWLSDFWLGEIHVAAESNLPQQDFIKFKKHWERCAEDEFAEPKLVVILDATPALLNVARDLRQPTLQLNSADEAWNRQEVLAAIEAMK